MKNYRHKWAKAGAFALTVLLLTITGLLFLETVLKTEGDFDSAFSASYLSSNDFGQDMQEAIFQVEESFNNFKSDGYTRGFNGFLKKNADGRINTNEDVSSDNINLEDLTFTYGTYTDSPGNLSDVDYYFYYKFGDLEVSNVGFGKILQQKYYIGKEPNTNDFTINSKISDYDKQSIKRNPYLSYFEGNAVKNADTDTNDTVLYVAYDDETVAQSTEVFENAKASTQTALINGSIMVFISLLLFIYLSIVAGRNPEDEELHLWKIDKLWGEANLFICAALAFSYVGMLVLAYDATYQKVFSEGTIRILVLSASIVIVSLAGMLWLSLCRKFKHKPRRYMFLTTGLILDFAMIPLRKIWIFTKTLPGKFKELLKRSFVIVKYFDSKLYSSFPVTQKIHRLSYIYLGLMIILTFFAIVFGLSWLGIFTLVCVGAMIYITILFTKKSKENFDEINQGFDKGYRESLKAEKMRVDLITNVSHDLKTPLTSIISYADLLKNEEMSDAAKDYVEILDKKAKRLNVIVGDLFDLSKSTSGNLEFDLEEINLKKLIEQTYADMDDKISLSPLKFVLQLPEEPVNIYADGKKMYRVFQNLFDNALKYSLDGTRVYITLDIIDNVAIASVKNIASYEMNFTEEEIAERFTRGDSARTTEGSGLGLSIAESFTQNCHGQFKIAIDGDLFKVIIKFQTV